jgi:hypothetical protein
MVLDYYSENVPVSNDEQEVFESFPVRKSQNNPIKNEDLHNPGIIIEEDNNSNKLKLTNDDFQSKLKNKIIFSNPLIDKDNKDLVRRNRLLKFKILENELRSLMNEITQDDESSEQPLREKIDILINDMNSFKLKNKTDTFIDYWDDQLQKINVANEKHMLSSSPSSIREINPSSSNFLGLESRVSTLENILGPSPSPSNDLSIQDTIDDLYTRINLIVDGGTNIKSIESEITKLIENCELFYQNSKKIKSASEIVPLTDKKICLLYEKVKQLPDFEKFSDKLIKRFKSLNNLIIDTSNTVQFMQGLENELTNIELRLDDWDIKLDKLELQIVKDRETLEKSTELLK